MRNSKKVLAVKSQVEGNINNAGTHEQQENGRADSFPAAGMVCSAI